MFCRNADAAVTSFQNRRHNMPRKIFAQVPNHAERLWSVDMDMHQGLEIKEARSCGSMVPSAARALAGWQWQQRSPRLWRSALGPVHTRALE